MRRWFSISTATLFVLAIIVSVFFISHQDSVSAAHDDKIIDLAALGADYTGVGWTYVASTNTITLTASDISMVGTKTNATTQLLINGNGNTLTLNNATYISSSQSAVRTQGNLNFNLTGNNSFVSTSNSGAFSTIALNAQCVTSQQVSFGGVGMLTLAANGTVSSSNQAIGGDCNVTFNGGTVNLQATNNNNANYGVNMNRTITMNGGALNVDLGNAASIVRGIHTGAAGKFLMTAGIMTIAIGNGTTTNVINSLDLTMPSTYKWTSSINKNGLPAIENIYPTNAFVPDTSYRFLRVEAPFTPNTPPAVDITSPSNGLWINDTNGTIVSGTITDPDADTWAVEVGYSQTVTPPAVWQTCGPPIGLSFSCTFNGSLGEDDYYLFVKVNDGEDEGTDYVQIYVDTSQPLIKESASGGTLLSGTTYIVSPDITLLAADPVRANGTAGSGVATIEYGWNSGVVSAGSCTFNTTISADNVMTTIPSIGDFTLCYRAYDNAGNISLVGTSFYTLMDVVPTIPPTSPPPSVPDAPDISPPNTGSGDILKESPSIMSVAITGAGLIILSALITRTLYRKLKI